MAYNNEHSDKSVITCELERCHNPAKYARVVFKIANSGGGERYAALVCGVHRTSHYPVLKPLAEHSERATLPATWLKLLRAALQADSDRLSVDISRRHAEIDAVVTQWHNEQSTIVQLTIWLEAFKAA